MVENSEIFEFWLVGVFNNFFLFKVDYLVEIDGKRLYFVGGKLLNLLDIGLNLGGFNFLLVIRSFE